MRKNKLLLLLALLLTAATGAWGMQIYISYPSWPTGTNVNGDGNLVLEMEASDSFENMKAKIEDKSGLNPTYMKLYFNSVEMANNETLNAKGVTSNSVLTLVYTLYTVSMKSGTQDADKWTVKVGDGQAQALPIGGLKGDGTETVTLQYNGRLKVKGVKATSDAKPAVKPAATVTTAPTAKTGVKAGEDVAIVNAGVATGGTMMYMVNATQPASTDGFSATVPTAEGLTAGTYYVWYYVKADATHTDSEISASGIEVTIDAAGPPALNLTSPAVGQVIGDDGKNYDYASLPSGMTAVAKICYVSGEHGLALALTDEGEMDWSTAMSTYAAHTPAFTGGTWKLATEGEWTNMITAAGSYTALRDGFSSVDGYNLTTDPYWSSTEAVVGQRARACDFSNGYWLDFRESNNAKVRACLAF